jgi:hypothetical protein
LVDTVDVAEGQPRVGERLADHLGFERLPEEL